MNDTDKKDFASIIRVTWQTYGRNEPDKETMRYWYSKLEKHSISEVGNAFDKWIMHSKQLPTIKDIDDLLKPKESDYKALPKKIDYEAQHAHVVEVKNAIEKMTRPKRDMKLWAHNILENPKFYPEISIRFAKEALGMGQEDAFNAP